MAYTDPQPLSQTRVVSIVVVILIHALLLYWMFNGGYAVTKKTLEDLKVIDVQEPPPPPEKLPPPPPPDKMPPPPETPVVKQIVQTPQPQVPQYNPAPPNPPPPSPPTPPAPPAPPAPPPPSPPPPPPPSVAVKGTPRGDPKSWASTDDYPPSALRDGSAGRTSFSLEVGTDGRPTGCTVTKSSGFPILDDTTCRLMMRRAKFSPAKDTGGQPIAFTYTNSTTWQIPKE